MTNITIYHNPDCGTSRNTLALIRNSGVEPTIVLYLVTPPTRETLQQLIDAMGIGLRALVRQNTDAWQALGPVRETLSDEQLLDAMLAQPILINRPIVVTPLGTRLCRPSEQVLDILPDAQRGPFTKEDGEVVIDAQGRRVSL
ncbi:MULTISPECIES: arsenate reductase (glutaredoxin) [Pantoea]|jgi:arsenate reductase (glutaredoxin)|uniref:arsenate reductase (glutaredoxin) n=1 Tax=Pantoea TaxID=53335 RepID=UPI0007365922|nr:MULTISPECIES: arsenate reductase (glutaredoxin) [Pantoea]KAA8673837.1 arsenate reductase (glutaredoxin) [Pantoea dispersa]KTS16941.1 arsenate reductase [Pantoea dispersa]KTS88473.1 arsenate reductase [Pantoea dispersa]MBU6520062.1 arsenate reductase (glutaredoxin) [Pantoea sp. B270]MDI6633842.1 arsenate reductase (glutaredoxin) [Pantoea dispersa]